MQEFHARPADPPTPQDPAEAGLFSECRDAVLSYADLCTSSSLTVHQLATEAFARGMREVRAAGNSPVRGPGRARCAPPATRLCAAPDGASAGYR